MKTNVELQKDVQDALKWEPLLKASDISIIVKDGVVSLTGVVDSYAKKKEAENAAKKVLGIKSIVENIEVKFPSSWSKSDTEIAEEALIAFKLNSSVPAENVSVKVENGVVTLSGEIPWNYQREAAKNAINYLVGVKNVINNILIKTEKPEAIEQKDVENAISRNGWYNGTNNIKVSVLGTKVALSGTVNSWYQKDEATRIAWNTPGIRQVKNDLVVDFEHI
jgi:osmotically-inducible protein OsmY